jgi:hypothetical protein
MNIKMNVDSEIKDKDILEKLKKVLFKSMVKMNELAVMNCHVDTGAEANSIRIYPSNPGETKYVLADGKEYGIDLEFGTKPHYVSPFVLKGWAGRVLGDESAAFPIAKKIAMFGTDAYPYFRPSLSQVKNVFLPQYMKEAML